jgi:RNA exonuclease 1
MSPPVASLGNGLGFQGGASSPASHPGSEADGFTEFLSKEERRKLRKVEKHRPQFQFDVSQFRLGRKIGIAVGRL